MNTSGTYVLWLPNWYPNRVDPFNGDFIQRQAEAAGLTREVKVIHVQRDREGHITRNACRQVSLKRGLEEIRCYYHSPKLGRGGADRFLSFLYFMILHFREIRRLARREGKPALIHLHIAGRVSLVAYVMSRIFRIPLLYSEQWTFLLPEARPSLFQSGQWLKFCYRLLLRNVAGVSVVSRYLGQCLRAWRPGLPYRVIPNVVDTRLFFPASEKEPDRTRNRFIHVSNMNDQKNILGLLTAFVLLKQYEVPFSLALYGPVSPEVQQYLQQTELTGSVTCYGAVSHDQIALAMRQADAFILYSRYETFGCVIIEAIASGLPVISSDFPVMRELIDENNTGYFVPGDQPEALADKIRWFMRQPISNAISNLQVQRQYAPEVVAGEFDAWYAEVLP